MTEPTTAVAETGNSGANQLIKSYQEMRNKGYNMISPSATFLQNIPDHMQIAHDIIVVNTTAAAKEVYNTGTNNSLAYALSKTAILKIASAAGIQIDPSLTKRLDDRKDKRYCAYQAAVVYTKPDGSRVGFKAEKTYDLDIIEEKITAAKEDQRDGQYSKPYMREAGWVEKQTKKEMLQIREHMTSLCETKALLRAIRGVLALKTSYTAEELAQPFVVTRVTFKLDYSDPATKARILDAALGSTNSLYGQQPQLSSPNEATQYLSAGSDGDDDENNPGDFGIPVEPTQPAIAAATSQAASEVVTETQRKVAIEIPATPVVKAENECTECPTKLNKAAMDQVKEGAPKLCPPCFDKAIAADAAEGLV